MKDVSTVKEKVILPENVQKTETEEDHTVMTEEAEKDTTEEEMIDMTDTTGIFVLYSDVIETGITEIDMTAGIETIETIEMIEVREDVIMTEIAMTEIATEMTEEEIVQDLTQAPSHPLKAVIVVIEKRRNKEEDVLEVELMFGLIGLVRQWPSFINRIVLD